MSVNYESGQLAPDAVRRMFDRIAPVYDVMNHTMTAGLDRRWRRLTAEAVVRPGDAVLEDVQHLVRNLIAMNEILRDNEHVSVRLVMNPDRMVIDEARRTFTYLNLYGYLTDAVVVNRVQRDPRRHGGADSLPALREALQLAQIKDENNLAERLCQTLSEQSILADLDRREVDRLRDTLRGVPLFTVPRLRKDVHDLATLWQIVEYLGDE